MKLRNIIILLAILVALGGVYLIVSQSDSEDSTEPIYLWQIETDDIEHIDISLPRQDMGQSFIKITNDDGYSWYFDDEQQSEIDPDRWGSGITLILSGPRADKIVNENPSEAQLAEYGLDEPLMVVTVTMEDSHTLIIELGDKSFGGDYYILIPGTEVVATIDYTWHDVMELLVTDPPYVSVEE